MNSLCDQRQTKESQLAVIYIVLIPALPQVGALPAASHVLLARHMLHSRTPGSLCVGVGSKRT